MSQRILLVEDEEMLSLTMAAYLTREGFEVEPVRDGALVMQAFHRIHPDLVLLDLMLPNVDGITLCRQIREVSQVPVIMLTARVDEVDRLLGLEIGADDYICKPYSPREVVARVKAVLRRYLVGLAAGSGPLIAASPLGIDEDAMEASWRGTDLELTAIEFRLLRTMAAQPRRVFSREQLMQRIYSDDRIVSDRTIDSHITKLRRKLAGTGEPEEVIRSVYGAGYKFEFPL